MEPGAPCSGASWLEAGATETTLLASSASASPSASPRSLGSLRSEADLEDVKADEPEAPQADLEDVKADEPEAPQASAEDEQLDRLREMTQYLELQFQEVCQCVQQSKDDLFERLELLFQEQAERQHDLQRKLDGFLENETSRCVAVAQAPELSPQPPTCLPPDLQPGMVPETEAGLRSDWADASLGLGSQGMGGLAMEKQQTDASMMSEASIEGAPTTLLQKEDEDAYQAALKKARQFRQRETKRLTRTVSSGVSEHWQIRLRDFMQTALMESICAFVIFTNSILIGIQTDYMAKRVGEEPPIVFTVVDAAYTAIFGLELAVRLLGSGLGFFYRDAGLFWNYLDCCIVLPSIIELVLAFVLQIPSVTTDITVVRVLRITRVFRVIRVVKVMKFIRSLRQLVESVMHTMRSLAWSMLLLVVIIYVFAIMFTDASASFQEENKDNPLNLELTTYFADLHISMHTLFRSTSGGIDWGIVAYVLGEVHWVWMYLFTLYVAFCMFAVLNVMTGIFCQVAVESSWNDPQLLLQHSMVERERHRDSIRQLFHHFGRNSMRRKITLLDVEEQFDDEAVQGLMNLLDIYPDSGWSLFKQLDDNGDASISEEEFISGILRLRGTAKSWDIEKIMQEQRGLRKVLDAYVARVPPGDAKSVKLVR